MTMKMIRFIIISFLIIFLLHVDVQANSKGYSIQDPIRSLSYTLPNEKWSVNLGKKSVTLTHNDFYDVLVSLKKSWVQEKSSMALYKKRFDDFKKYSPGTKVVRQDQYIQFGNIQAVSFTYIDGAQKKLIREILFVYKNQSYELLFSVNEVNFKLLKQDFSFILQHFKPI